MRPVVGSVDHLPDLHSMHERCATLTVCGPLARRYQDGTGIGCLDPIISDAGHPHGHRLRDYSSFGEPASHRSALLIKTGKHFEYQTLAAGGITAIDGL